MGRQPRIILTTDRMQLTPMYPFDFTTTIRWTYRIHWAWTIWNNPVEYRILNILNLISACYLMGSSVHQLTLLQRVMINLFIISLDTLGCISLQVGSSTFKDLLQILSMLYYPRFSSRIKIILPQNEINCQLRLLSKHKNIWRISGRLMFCSVVSKHNFWPIILLFSRKGSQ